MRKIILGIILMIPQLLVAQTTWYSYQDGNWSNPNIWTTDGSAFPLYVNPSALLPSPTDNVVINNGKIISIRSTDNNQRTVDGGDNDQSVNLNSIDVQGSLDLIKSSGHIFTTITGIGNIYLEGDASNNENFPSSTTNTFFNSDGGTITLKGTGMTLNQARTYGKFKINLTNATDIVTLTNNITVNGNFTLTKGKFQFSNATNAVQRNLTVNADVSVSANSSMTVGTGDPQGTTTGYGNYHKYFHLFTVKGNFTNNGIIKFHNIAVPNYGTRTTTGGVSLVFSGATNNTFYCNNTTELYYLVINKGTDQTYSLTTNSSNAAYFSLYGDNNQEWDATDAANPENRKALWVAAGKAIFEGFIHIPTLTEGVRDWIIGENASLVLNSPNVKIVTTAAIASGVPTIWPNTSFAGLSYASASGINEAPDVCAIYVNGSLVINDGTFSTNNSNGIVYRADAASNRVEINGGTVLADQFRISSAASAATAKMSYIQTGGTLYLKAYKTGAASFDLSAQLGTFTMSGGDIIFNDASNGSPSAINIACPASNISVTGGTITINNTATNHILTTAPIYNLILNAAGTITAQNDLIIQNSLSVNAGTFNMGSFNMTIAKDMTLATGITLSNWNNLTFNGVSDSRIYNSMATSFTVAGNFIVNKSDLNKSVSFETSPTNAMTLSTGQLRVENGNLDNKSFTITANNIYVADSIGTTASTGNLILGTAAVTISSVGGVLHKVSFNNANGATLTGDLTVDGLFTFTNGLFKLNTYKLTFGPNATLSSEVKTNYSTTKMFQLSGNASDGGLERYTNGDNNYLFPIGTNANATTRYTPVYLDMSGKASAGYVQFNVVDQFLTTLSNNTALSYYWRLRYRGFTNKVQAVTNIDFYYDVSDDANTGQNYEGGYVLDESPYTLASMNVNTDKTNKVFNFNQDLANGNTVQDWTIVSGSYTSAKGNAWGTGGGLKVFYSRGSGDWNTNTTWSFTGHTGAAVTNGECCPVAGDIAIIGYNGATNHVVTAAVNVAASVVEFNSIVGATSIVGNLSTLTLAPNLTLTANKLTGIGQLRLQVSNSGFASVVNTTDIGDFIANPTNTFYYDYIAGSGNKTLTVIASYPTLRFSADPVNASTPKTNKFLLSGNISCQNLIIDGNASLRLDRNITIANTLYLGPASDGELLYYNGATAATVTVKNIVYGTTAGTTSENRNVIGVETGNTNATLHVLNVSGNITMAPGSSGDAGALFDLYNTGTQNNTKLNFTGSGVHTFNRTTTVNTPELYQLSLDIGSSTASTLTINHNFTLNAPTNGTTKALTLTNGLLVLNNASINANLSTGGSDFTIPSTAGIEIQAGTLNLNGTTAMKLNGLLKLSGASATMNMTGGENNLIYGTTGYSTINITNGTLSVGGQLRRETSSTAGVLAYTQSGGTLNAGVNAASVNNRGVFEIFNNPGSSFTLTGGSIVIYRDNGASPTLAALYLNPASSSISGTPSIIIGKSGTNPANPVTINCGITIPSLYVEQGANVTAKLRTQGLTITGNLDIGNAAGATFDANGLSLNIGGNLNNYGTYTANGNTLTFNGTGAQAYTGTGSHTIYNMTYSGSNTLTLSSNVTISNDLSISSSTGTIATGTRTISVGRHATVEGTITTTSGNGLIFNGGTDQNLKRLTSGTSNIDIVTINNGGRNVIVADGNGYSFQIKKALNLTNGKFDIGGNLLIMAESATINGTFSASNMIKTNNAYLDNGVRVILPSTNNAPLTGYVIPVGEVLYTPVTLNISNSGTGGSNKYVSVRPANESHPSVTDATKTLKYYWVVKSANITGLTGNFVFKYIDPTHVPATSVEANYLPARLLSTSSTWDKAFNLTDINKPADLITFSLATVNSNQIEGEYTAGETAGIGSNVQTISTTGSGGNFSNPATWSGGVAPSNGAIITVASGATLTMDTNNRRFLRTDIQSGAALDMSTSTGQSIGTVTGTGDIKISSSSFPNGDYASFFTCSGGGIQYQGSTNYNIMASISNIRNLTLSGTGQRLLSSNNINVCNDLTIAGISMLNDNNINVTIGHDLIVNSGTIVTGSNNIWDITNALTINGGTTTADVGTQINVSGVTSFVGGTFNASSAILKASGNFTRTSGTFNAGTSTVEFSGSNTQSISGNFTSANSSSLYKLKINKTSNNVTVSTAVDITNNLNLTKGNFITTVANIFRLGLTATVSNASSTSLVIGPVYKTLNNSTYNNFMFPVGTTSFYAPAGAINTSISGDWYAVFKASAIANPTSHDLGVNGKMNNSYWTISGPNGATANIVLSFNGFNISAQPGDWNDLRVMKYVTNTWVMQGNADGSDDALKTVTGVTASSFTVHDFTLGSVSSSNPLPVELTYFKGIVVKQSVHLEWETASEKNNSHFNIEKSRNGLVYEYVGSVEGNGTISEKSKYGFVDHSPYFGVSYYRLVQTDYDGKQVIYDAIKINNKYLKDGIDVSVFPNPTLQDNINVNLSTGDENSIIHITIINLQGQIVHTQQMTPLLGTNDYQIKPTGYLGKGLYHVTIKQGVNQVIKKIIIN